MRRRWFLIRNASISLDFGHDSLTLWSECRETAKSWESYRAYIGWISPWEIHDAIDDVVNWFLFNFLDSFRKHFIIKLHIFIFIDQLCHNHKRQSIRTLSLYLCIYLFIFLVQLTATKEWFDNISNIIDQILVIKQNIIF